MVRDFAANAIFLRDGNDALQSQNTWLARLVSGVNLDRTVVFLVLVFLGVVTGSIAIQSTSSWHEQLEASESNLRLAAGLVATTMALQPAVEAEKRELPTLLPEASQPGRRFVILDADAHMRAGHVAREDKGRKAHHLFSDPVAFDTLSRTGTIERLPLRNGERASVGLMRIAGSGDMLLTYQPVRDELALWWRHASAIGAILLSFGAVTLAFTLVFLMQRQRALNAGKSASHMSTLAELALENGKCGLWDWTISSSRIHWSASMHHLLGQNLDGNRDFASIAARLHPEDIGLLAGIRAGVAAGQRDFNQLFRMKDESGAWHWLRMRAVAVDGAKGHSPRLFGIVMDVTQERALEDEGHRADARLRDAIESLSEAFVLWDESNHLVMCNSKYQAFHALPAHLIQRGVAYKTLMAEAREPRMLIEIDRGSQPDSGSRTYEAQFQDGRWLLINERPTKDGGYVSVGTDITARKLQETRLIDHERKLQMTINDLGSSREAFRRQAGQLAELADRYLEQKAEVVSANRAKAEFLANMNHEIRTPLNHIIGFAQMIESEVFGPCGSPRYAEYARHIGTSGASLMGLVSDILDMARIEAGRVTLDRTPAMIGMLLESAAGEVREAALDKTVSIEIEPDAGAPLGQRQIMVDAEAIKQALAHLLRNSIRLSPRGGRVSIRARMSHDHVNIFVADRACTLSPGDLGKMIDPFGHIDGMLEDGCKGSGLGVSIARSLIELHGGTMRLRSSEKIGSLIMIHLPVAPVAVQLDLPMSA